MKTSDRVENILRASQQARNSDKFLMIVYMQKSGMELTDKQIEIFKKLPAMETITRVRRQLQEEGKYPPSPEVEKARYDKYKRTKRDINYVGADEVLNNLGYKIAEDDPWN